MNRKKKFSNCKRCINISCVGVQFCKIYEFFSSKVEAYWCYEVCQNMKAENSFRCLPKCQISALSFSVIEFCNMLTQQYTKYSSNLAIVSNFIFSRLKYVHKKIFFEIPTISTRKYRYRILSLFPYLVYLLNNVMLLVKS